MPHGDALDGLLALFVEQHAPESREVVTTTNQTPERAGLDTGGRDGQVLRASLHRLNGAKFVTQNAWRAHGQRRRTTQTFPPVEGLACDGEE